MNIDHDTPEDCTHCSQNLSNDPHYDTNGNPFCSPGCRTVHGTLEKGQEGAKYDIISRSDDDPGIGGKRRDRDTPQGGPTQTFLRVDGMHSATCEAFLEARAEGCESVIDADASYVSESIRIDYNSEQISQDSLCETLSTIGYTAVPREAAPIDSNTAAEQGDRQLDSVLGYRYAVGVLFGSFLMLTYVVIVYPAHLSALLGEGALPLFAGAFGFGGGDVVLIMPLFLLLTGAVLFFTGLPLLRDAYVSLKTRQPTTELLTAITVVSAYLYSTVAMFLGRTDVYFDLTIVVAAVVVAAIFYESLIKQRAMGQLTDLTISQINEARRYFSDGTTKTVPVGDLESGDRILVRQEERIPVDGELASGECTVDEAIITGESLPIVKSKGDEVVGGSIVTEDAAVIRVGDQATSSIDQLITTVWNLQSADHGIQRQANRLAGYIIPVIVVAASLIGGVRLLRDGNPSTALLSGLAVLLVASPWTLGLATPLTVATILEEAMRRGIVIFDETIFERLREIDVVVFDKTGTLTTGQMSVIDAAAPPELLEAAAALERRASHPAAEAIAAEFDQVDTAADTTISDGGAVESDKEEDGNRIREFRSHSMGVGGMVEDVEVLVGHPDLFESQEWEVSDKLLAQVKDIRSFGRLPVLVGRDGQAEGFVVVGDEPRENWDETITQLSEQDMEIVVLTGDDEDAAEFFSQHPHIKHVFAEVPPAGKTATVRRLQIDRYVTMIGDGTNDAPALAQADLGISLGGGTAIASDAADIAIVDDDLRSVETTFDLAYAARRRVTQNTALALLYNVIAILSAAVGLFNPLFAMVAVVVNSGLLAVNSFRELLDE